MDQIKKLKINGKEYSISGDNVFIRYSANADGEGFTEAWTEGQTYMGVATGQTAPTDKAGYTWVKFGGGGSAANTLVKPETAPTETRIVTIDANGEQVNLKLSDLSVGRSYGPNYGFVYMERNSALPIFVDSEGKLMLGNTNARITARSGTNPIRNSDMNFAVKSALTDNKRMVLTDDEKATAQETIGVTKLYKHNAWWYLDIADADADWYGYFQVCVEYISTHPTSSTTIRDPIMITLVSFEGSSDGGNQMFFEPCTARIGIGSDYLEVEGMGYTSSDRQQLYVWRNSAMESYGCYGVVTSGDTVTPI